MASGDAAGRSPGPAAWLDRHLDLLSTLVLTVATVATAWCAFQASVFGGQQGLRLAEAAAANREAQRLDLEANQLTALDVSIFMNYLEARAEGAEQLARFYRERFPARMHQAVEEWLAMKPLQNPDAPPHPFALPSYRQPAREQAATLTETAGQRRQTAEAVNHYSDMYTLAAVVLATTLFFAGMAPKPRSRPARLLLLGVAAAELAVTLIVIASLPLAQL